MGYYEDPINSLISMLLQSKNKWNECVSAAEVLSFFLKVAVKAKFHDMATMKSREKKSRGCKQNNNKKKYAVAIATDNLDEAKKYSGLLCGWHV